MGIIQRQAIKGALFSYTGIIVGFINAIILAPRILTPEQIGLTSILIAYSLPFAQLGSLGFANVTNRFFPYFRNAKEKHNGFLALALMVSGGGLVISLLIYIVLRPVLIKDSIEQSSLFVEYMDYLIPLIAFTLLFNILDSYNRALFDAVLGSILKDFTFKVLYCLILVSFFAGWLTFPQFVLAFICANCLPGFLMALILIYRRQFSLSFRPGFLSRRLIRLMISVGVFGILAGLSGMAVSTIDKFMINSMIDLKATGIYTVSFYFSVLLMVPVNSLRNISIPVIAESMKAKDFKIIQKVYYKSALNQLVIGFLIFIGIWDNIHNVFAILPDEYQAGKYVILFMMVARLFEMASGVSNIIIATSRYYRFQTYLMVFLIVIVILANLIFIPLFGITGAAVAASISAFLYNLMRIIFIYWKFRIHPYSYKFLILILVSVIAFLIGYFIPHVRSVILDILLRSVAITLVFGILVLITSVSEEINAIYQSLLSTILNLLRRRKI